MRIIGAIAAFLLVFIGLPVGLSMWIDTSTCHSKSSKMELEGSWGPLQECMVRVDGKWMPLDSYKVVKVRPLAM